MTAANAPPKRSSQACNRCRQQKMKCSGGPIPCERCARFSRQCIFDPVTVARPPPPSPRPQQTQRLTQSEESYLQEAGEDEEMRTSSRKRRHDETPTPERRVRPVSTQPYSALMPPVATAYSTVQELETGPSLWPDEYQTLSTRLVDEDREPSRRPAGLSASVLECLSEAGVSVADAEEMFQLFGNRISPMIPSFYTTSFHHLPSQPVFVLAAIHAVARYLPDSADLRSRVWRILRRLLTDLVLQPAGSRPNEEVIENMHGLTILYACCEATGPVQPDTVANDNMDMLSLKSIAEGYAVKFKLGLCLPVRIELAELLPVVWLVWLYTMSHHCAVIHGCARTISASIELHRAKELLDRHVEHPTILRLLGECELCLLWEMTSSQRPGSPEIIFNALRRWEMDWNKFLTGAAAQGRQLFFHFSFVRFHLLTHLQNEAGELHVAVPESLDAAYAFLQCIRSLSPISKDRLRYLCDFAFVMIAYVCLYVIRTLVSGTIGAERRREFLFLVNDLATLMQSFGVKADTRPAIYGCALEAICKQHQAFSTDVHLPLLADLAPTIHQTSEAQSGQRTPGVNERVEMAPSVAIDYTDDPEIIPQSRFSDEFWPMEPDLSAIFNGIMSEIPVPGE